MRKNLQNVSSCPASSKYIIRVRSVFYKGCSWRRTVKFWCLTFEKRQNFIVLKIWAYATFRREPSIIWIIKLLFDIDYWTNISQKGEGFWQVWTRRSLPLVPDITGRGKGHPLVSATQVRTNIPCKGSLSKLCQSSRLTVWFPNASSLGVRRRLFSSQDDCLKVFMDGVDNGRWGDRVEQLNSCETLW